ncbi:subtilase-type protease inhibitor [Dactylosporangium sp. AC04546]|uniref:subtilase-type protease inhibitor n=1 Tax=Dactylosporangium sp. AC04546 TaxID=2862460 RepID=UPI001EDF172B|nr:subtilase-type protease inhibitor [Dactylosporangium sp. AC04546]WVK85745.1 subtilase-type protease inhibitor [Dactylosporangium sp. AC04546]
MGVRRLSRGAATAALTAAAIVAADAGPAAAATPKPTLLTLTVAKGEATKPAQRRAFLTCSPAGGTHKQARNACAELAKVGGNFGRLQVAGGACTMQYDPVTVTAQGRWKGRKVAYQHTFGNACTLSTATGPVFSL